MRHKTIITTAALTAGLAGLSACAPEQQARQGRRTFASDFTGGAKSCSVPTNAAPGASPVAMTVVNDGGWCGVLLSREGSPYSVGAVRKRPAHGKTYVHSVGDQTRIDYTPDPAYSGPDSFTVQLFPGPAELSVDVTVQPGVVPAAAAPPAAPPPPKKPASAPARRR